MESLNDAETRNAEVDHETVRRTQELLNTYDFFCGNADGISEKRTVKSIKAMMTGISRHRTATAS